MLGEKLLSRATSSKHFTLNGTVREVFSRNRILMKTNNDKVHTKLQTLGSVSLVDNVFYLGFPESQKYGPAGCPTFSF